jgi:guanylate kinase
VKDLEYAARYVFIKPSSAEILETRLKEKGTSSEEMGDILKRLPDQVETAVVSHFYDTVIIGDNVEEAYESLRGFIYGAVTNGTAANGEPALDNTERDRDEAMPDASGDSIPGVKEANGVEA